MWVVGSCSYNNKRGYHRSEDKLRKKNFCLCFIKIQTGECKCEGKQPQGRKRAMGDTQDEERNVMKSENTLQREVDGEKLQCKLKLMKYKVPHDINLCVSVHQSRKSKKRTQEVSTGQINCT